MKKITWWWIFWTVLICTRNPAGARFWSMRKLIDAGMVKATQTCPRRGAQLDSGQPPLDWWDYNRWGWAPWRTLAYWWRNGPVGRIAKRISNWGWEVARRRNFDRRGLVARWIGERFNWMQGGTRWEWPWQPRTCSHCGGAHPEDIIRLVREGWESEGTTKSYKRYIEPPRVGLQKIQTCPVHSVEVAERAWYAVPPVKLYVHHFNDAQVAEFNALIDSQRARMAPASEAMH
jgi:hypothetical protein